MEGRQGWWQGQGTGIRMRKSTKMPYCDPKFDVGRYPTCTSRPVATARYLPSGLKRAQVTGFLKEKWCSSALRRRLTSSARPSLSTDSSSWPSGDTLSTRTYRGV